MKKYKFTLRIVTITLFLLIFCSEHGFCFDLDMTVDDDIRKNYDSSKLIQDTNTLDFETLPDLPENLKGGNDTGVNDTEGSSVKVNNKESSSTGIKTKPATVSSRTPNVSQKQLKITGNVKISKGTSFDVVNISKISDWQKKGAVVKFKTTKLINKKGYTLPVSTVFTGEVIESHQPQISCNGGLVVIRIRNVVYKGQKIPINAYVTRANDKKIFFNDIKGDRTYLKTMWKKGNWGRVLFNRMVALSINLCSEGSTVLLAPFPFLYGTICAGANTIISPITAFFSKGKHVSINSGSKFRIKLLDDAYIE